KQTGRTRSKVMIPRNTPLPAKSHGRFSTSKADQRNIVVSVVEGGDAGGRNATLVGKCVISELPAGLPANIPVDVNFSYSANGCLTVEAELPELRRKASTTIERQSGVPEYVIKAWIEKIESGVVLSAPSEEVAETEQEATEQAPAFEIDVKK